MNFINNFAFSATSIYMLEYNCTTPCNIGLCYVFESSLSSTIYSRKVEKQNYHCITKASFNFFKGDDIFSLIEKRRFSSAPI